MIGRTRLRRDERATVSIEFALFAPVLLALFFGIIQLGVLFLANAGLNHAVAEGARLATLWPRPSATEIGERIEARRFGGLRSGGLHHPVLSYGKDDGLDYVDISLSYDVQLEFVFMDAPEFTITRTRRAFLI